MQFEKTLNLQNILGRWIHAHEEDPQDGSGREVYRPGDWPLGPSRGRRGFEIKANNRAIILEIAAMDGSVVLEGSWSIEQGNILVIHTGSEIKRLLLEQASSERLIVRELQEFQ